MSILIDHGSMLGWLLACMFAYFPSHKHANVSRGQICPDKLTCCHIEIKRADQTSYRTQSQYTDTRPTSPSADPITPGAWRGSYWSTNFQVRGMTRPGKSPAGKEGMKRSLEKKAPAGKEGIKRGLGKSPAGNEGIKRGL